MSVNILNKIDIALPYLENNQTLDVSGLTKEEADYLKEERSNEYDVRSVEEKKGSGRYAVNIRPRGVVQNA